MSLTFSPQGLSAQLSNHEIIFYRELYTVVGINYSDPKFNVYQLAEEMGLLRRQLYRQMEKLNLSPADFIREFRMRRAYQFLESGAVSRIKQLSFMVGYENCETFSKHFIQHFGYRPSEVLRKEVA